MLNKRKVIEKINAKTSIRLVQVITYLQMFDSLDCCNNLKYK